MAEPSPTGRALAWAEEMQRVHHRLREALEVARASASDPVDVAERDLLLYCWGFCQALAGHHAGEDAVLFPAVQAEQPDLAAVLARLREDHELIGGLLQAFSRAVDTGREASELEGHLGGIAAIMESHFRYEERVLLGPLRQLRFEAGAEDAFGPLAGRRLEKPDHHADA